MPAPNGTAGPRKPCVGIWRLIERFHCGRWTELYYAQPAESSGSPRADYVVKMVCESAEDRVEGIAQIKNEAAAASATAHPNLMPALDAKLSAQRPYLVFPRLEGRPLSVWLESSYSQPIPVCLWWVRQALQAMKALHDAGWLHGDIKPDNMLVSTRGHLTLIDCGLASRIGEPVDKNRFQGTPGYAAPEVVQGGERVVPESDVYSLGIVLYQLLSRKSDVSSGGPNLGDLRLRRSSQPLIDMVTAMTQAVPSKRPETEQLIEDLFRLEIETLGLHIQPEECSGKAA